ncbi:MAG TPA: branched-chain amino acid ABC transporter permease [Terriglobales bacterium]|nr:branched-chain amino acid ABC transporter permease [Terriglobales bacterium]
MSKAFRPRVFYLAIIAIAAAAPWLVPSVVTQMAFLWLMIVFALTWDIMGGQMGYDSFGNILFFGVGAYVCAVVQRDSGLGYYSALAVGAVLAAIGAAAAAAILGPAILALRGHYFAIATLGVGIAAADIAAGWQYIGAASGIVTPLFPGAIESRGTFFYYLLLLIAAVTFLTLRWLYRTRFGTAINAIRDDEEKAEAMGIRTTRYKSAAWCISALFLGLAGAIAGNFAGFIDPHEFAFAGSTFGVWMILMATLGGRGTLWGPVIGAIVFHVTQELFWTYLLGWQRVAMGLFIVVVVVFFPSGIVGWFRQRWGQRVADMANDLAASAATRGAAD